MELHERVAGITSKTDLVEFVEALAKDLRDNPSAWENATLERYLEALARWLEASDGYYVNHGLPIPALPSWRSVADMLVAAKMYE